MADYPPTWVHEKVHMTEAYLPIFDLLARSIHLFEDDTLCCALAQCPKLDVADTRMLR
jgi:hypothetical protein